MPSKQTPPQQRHDRRKKLVNKNIGIRKIDVSALRRMLTWSIEQAERHLDNLYCALDVLDSTIENKVKK